MQRAEGEDPLSPWDDRDIQRSRVRHDSDDDLSPAKVSGATEDTDRDFSPKRCRTDDSAVTRTRSGSASDLSPPRPGMVPRARSRYGGTYQRH